MSKEMKYRIWAGIGASLLVLCLPLGIYSAIEGTKLFRRAKIGDYSNADKCVSHIKASWIITIAFYVLMIILAATGALD